MRPKIICHMVSSIDGRLLVNRWVKPDTKTELGLVSKFYGQTAELLNADGWMVGRKTMEDYVHGTPHAFDTDIPGLRAPFIGNRNGRNVAVVIDLHGKLHYGQDHAEGDHVIAILGKNVSDKYLAELRHDGVSYALIDTPGADALSRTEELQKAMNILGETFGLKTLMLQGGGITNGAFLKAGLIDEISLLVYPGVDGLAGVPGIFEYHGAANERPAEGQTLRLISTDRLDNDFIWLRYDIEKKNP